jgi:protease IV
MSELEPPQTAAATDREPAVPPVPPAVPPAAETAVPPYMPPPPPPRKRKGFWFGALTGCAILLLASLAVIIAMIASMGEDRPDLSLSGNKVAVIPIEGEIVDARETLDALKKYADNNTVKAIIIRINSPGGGVVPSQEIYAAIRHTRADSGKPIVASMDSVAASGGYYIAAACDQIVANPGTITGSIGVILQWFDLKELVKWAKLKPETITSGQLKDAGSPYREMTPAERAYFQNIVTQLHGQFVRDVAHGRREKLKYDEVARLADGRVFTGEEALRLKLVDQLGTIDDAVRTAGKLAGIEGEPTKYWPKRREDRLLDLFTEGDASAVLEKIVARRVPQFLYRW